MRRLLSFNLVALGLLAACVTVNVYFPSAAAEQAADRIIDTVTGTPQDSAQPQGSRPQTSTEKDPSTSHLAPVAAGESQRPLAANDVNRPAWLMAAGRLLESLVPAAHAQSNANLDISTPEIRAVTASMQQRFGQLQKYFASGVVGLTNDGLVEIRDANAAPLAERAVVKRLVAEDNRDRATLYAEIAKANGHPEWEPDIRRTFARRWVERGAKPGWYYQDSGGNWVQK